MPAESDPPSAEFLQQELDAAFALHGAAKFAEAAQQYQRAIAALQANLDSKRPAIEKGQSKQAMVLCVGNLAHINEHELKDFGQARQWYAEATRLTPDSAQAYHAFGQALLRHNLLQESLDQFTIDLRLRPDFSPSFLALAMCYHGLGSLDAAVDHATRATELDPSLTLGFKSAGTLLHLAGRDRAAEEILKRGLALDPTSTDMLVMRGQALSDLGDRREALLMLGRALQLDPANIEARLFLGREYFMVASDGELSHMADTWRKSVDNLDYALANMHGQGQRALVVLNHLAWAHWQLGNHAQAYALLEQGLAIDADFCELHVRRLLMQAGSCNFTQVCVCVRARVHVCAL